MNESGMLPVCTHSVLHRVCRQPEAKIGKCEDPINRYFGSSSQRFLNSFMDLAAGFRIVLVRIKPIYHLSAMSRLLVRARDFRLLQEISDCLPHYLAIDNGDRRC